MNEQDFWGHLMMRVTRELGGMQEKRLRWFWCDGFLPERIEHDERGAWIVGEAWIGDERLQWLYAFRLRFGPAGAEPPQSDWSGLLPSEERTSWLRIEPESELLELHCA